MGPKVKSWIDPALERVWRENRCLSDASIVMYRECVQRFVDYCKTKGLTTESELTSSGVSRDLAERDKYQFQWWACSLVNAQPYAGKKKGADGGVDGLIFFQDEGGAKALSKKIIVSVKGGEHVGVTMVKDLIATCARQKAEIGLFVTLNAPTKPMQTEAASAGFYTSPVTGTKFPKIQITPRFWGELWASALDGR